MATEWTEEVFMDALETVIQLLIEMYEADPEAVKECIGDIMRAHIATVFEPGELEAYLKLKERNEKIMQFPVQEK